MRRTEPKSVGALFDELFNSPHIAAKIAEGCLPETWREVVGDAIANQTSQIRLVRGELQPPWGQCLRRELRWR